MICTPRRSRSGAVFFGFAPATAIPGEDRSANHMKLIEFWVQISYIYGYWSQDFCEIVPKAQAVAMQFWVQISYIYGYWSQGFS